MGSILTRGGSSLNKCIHWDETYKKIHRMTQPSYMNKAFANQNPDDFGFLYYVDPYLPKTFELVGTLIYDFDKFSHYSNSNQSPYLCDESGAQYIFDSSGPYKSYENYGSYKLFDSEKLIRSDDHNYCNLNPTTTIYNNSGSWRKPTSANPIGGGFTITFDPLTSSGANENIYVYLTNGPLRTHYFNLFDMTDPEVLCTNHYALQNNILRVYDMGNPYNYRASDMHAYISIIFNNIGYNSTSGYYSIFYGFNTWIYIYFSAGSCMRKTANVSKYNYNNTTASIISTYTFDHYDDNIGYKIIGFPMFDYQNTGSIGRIVNYYDIVILDS